MPTRLQRRPLRPNPDYFLDPDRGIIAAGPVVVVDRGGLGPAWARAVLRSARGGYRHDVELLDDRGQHVDWDLNAGGDHVSYIEAARAFLEADAALLVRFPGFHDHNA